MFNYNSGTAELLGTILSKVSGKRLDKFAMEALFDPLGIEDWDWDGSSGFNPAAASGLRLRPRDLAKIGQLMLERGKWRGQQIVSSAWIEDSTTPPRQRRRRSYQGWVPKPVPRRPHSILTIS